MSRAKAKDDQLGIFAPAAIAQTGIPVKGVCQICGFTCRAAIVDGMVRGCDWRDVPCAVMGGPCGINVLSRVRFTPIRHRVKAGKAPTRCGSACLGARGNTCDCECGGHNHGVAQ